MYGKCTKPMSFKFDIEEYKNYRIRETFGISGGCPNWLFRALERHCGLASSSARRQFENDLCDGRGGFIGHHLVKRLKAEGNYVIGVDLKYPEYEQTAADQFHLWISESTTIALAATYAVDEVYQLCG